MAWPQTADDSISSAFDGGWESSSSDGRCQKSQKNAWNQGTSNGTVNLCELTMGMSAASIVGVVIAKEETRHFLSKKDPTSERHVLSFTLRDSPRDFINVSCWGTDDFINNTASLFNIGAVVELCNAVVQPKPSDGSDEKFRPATSSSYQLSLNESRGSIKLYGGWKSYTSLLHIPVKAHNDFYTISDIQVNATSLQGHNVNLLAAVKQVHPVKDFTTRMGKQVRRCEVRLFDQTASDFVLVLWNGDSIMLAQEWTPKQNVVFVADARVQFDEYKKTMTATSGSKTIITVDPDTKEATQLYQYAQTVDIDISNVDKQNKVDLDSVQTVVNVAELKAMSDSSSEVQHVILYAFISSFNVDIEDTAQIMTTRCSKCRLRVDSETGACKNQDCPMGSAFDMDPSQTETQFSVTVSLSDHTGTLKNCTMSDDVVQTMLNCNVTQYMKFDTTRKTNLKWKFLLERCQLYVKISMGSTGFSQRRVTVLRCSPASPGDVSTHLH